MPTPERQVVEWIDAYGNRWLQTIDSLDTGGTDGIVTAIHNLSNAVPFWRAKGPLLIPGGAPVANQWPSLFDRAELQGGLNTTAVGTYVKLVIPAPKASLFLADGETVDLVQIGAGSALGNACNAILRGPNGAGLNVFHGGMRDGTAGRP